MLLVSALITGCGTQWDALDLDGDGTPFGEDCDETNPEISPQAAEDWYNGIDENCDGNDADKDGDGFVPDFYVEAYPDVWDTFEAHLAAGDCFDDPGADLGDYEVVAGQGFTQPTAAEINPDAQDTWYDGPDQDCNGADDFDADEDGYLSVFHVNRSGSVGDDCFDIASEDYPDEDFAALIPEGCNIEEPAAPLPEEVHPDAEDIWYDGIDANCDDNDFDADGDTYGCDDCDDSDPEVFPNDAVEIWYDGIDDNCDNNDGDMDGDGFVDRDYAAATPSWQDVNPFKQDGDCWDDLTDPGTGVYSPAINGGADLLQIEVNPDADDQPYDAIDADCQDDSDFDADGDTYDTSAYDDRSGSPAGEDCDDTLNTVHPDAKEDCDTSYDDDCDGDTNDLNADNSTDYYYDGDEDEQGAEGSTPARYCEPNTANGYTSLNDDDCRDTDDTVKDGGNELCDGQDNDCSGSLPSDEIDNDGDKAVECTFDGGGWDGTDSAQTIFEGEDCDDSDNKAYPSAPEICDGIDNNTCSTSSLPSNEVDNDSDDFVECTLARAWQGTGSKEGDDCHDGNDNAYPGAAYNESSSSCREDADGDGYGDDTPPTNVTAGGDCDDSDTSIYDGATEVVADGIDQDCDEVDTCYTDDDKDTYGDTNTKDGIDLNCNRPFYKLANDSDDCDDTDDTVYPGASELCDGQLNDCGGSMLSDEVDGDTDFYVGCTLDGGGWDGSGTVVGGDDCDDNEGTIYPGAPELCDGQINNCNTSSLPSNESDDDTDFYVECTIDSGGWDGSSSVIGGDDCDPSDGNDYPGASETVANGDDEDCDGFDDCYDDSDNDGEGTTSVITSNDLDCSDTGESSTDSDCDGTDGTVYTGANELCDGQINDCDTSSLPSDEDDGDSDTYVECTIDSGGWDGSSSVVGGDDCKPADGTIYPGASETVADGIDQDCDAFDDCYDDSDGDDEGTTTVITSNDLDCNDTGEASTDTDCDGTDGTVYTGANELCDGQINDCDTSSLPTDESDDDSDTYVECTFDSGGWDGSSSVVGGKDCLDSNGDAYPGAAYNESNSSCREDADGDGYGDDTPPTGVTAGGDCDDSDNSIYEGANEVVADGVDQDCDGVDHCYTDADEDGEGFGNATAGNDLDCTDPGESDNNDDCDDGDEDNYSSNTEVCDDQDNDCDDLADELVGTSSSDCYESGDVYYTEFMRESDYNDPDGEWFEIYNDTNSTITLDGWELNRGSGKSFYVAPGALTIDADDYVVFCYDDHTLGNSCDYIYGSDVNASSQAGDTFNSTFTFNTNFILRIRLDGSNLDEVNFNSDLGSPTTGLSQQLDGSSWCDADSADLFYDETDGSDAGTPLADTNCAP